MGQNGCCKGIRFYIPYDCIIMSHSQFEKIPISAERKERMLQAQIDEIAYAIDDMKSQNGEQWTVKQMESQMSFIREQMQATSESVLKERQKELGERNVEQLSKIVDPINLSLKLMREALDNTKKEHSDSMTRLDATIEANMRNSKELGETADRLTRALLGRVKVQGNFGELKLRQLLDDLGLEENAQYTTQQGLTDRAGRTLRSDDDRRLIPDFILHFPNKRDVIVDSKVSLVAYEKYVNADEPLLTVVVNENASASLAEIFSKAWSEVLGKNFRYNNYN